MIDLRLEITDRPDERLVRGLADSNYIAVHQWQVDRRVNRKLKLSQDKHIAARLDTVGRASTRLPAGALVKAIAKTKQKCAWGLAEVISEIECRVTGNMDARLYLSAELDGRLCGYITGVERVDNFGRREMTEWRK